LPTQNERQVIELQERIRRIEAEMEVAAGKLGKKIGRSEK
jgi:hypothetical protein